MRNVEECFKQEKIVLLKGVNLNTHKLQKTVSAMVNIGKYKLKKC